MPAPMQLTGEIRNWQLDEKARTFTGMIWGVLNDDNWHNGMRLEGYPYQYLVETVEGNMVLRTFSGFNFMLNKYFKKD